MRKIPTLQFHLSAKLGNLDLNLHIYLKSYLWRGSGKVPIPRESKDNSVYQVKFYLLLYCINPILSQVRRSLACLFITSMFRVATHQINMQVMQKRQIIQLYNSVIIVENSLDFRK